MAKAKPKVDAPKEAAPKVETVKSKHSLTKPVTEEFTQEEIEALVPTGKDLADCICSIDTHGTSHTYTVK